MDIFKGNYGNILKFKKSKLTKYLSNLVCVVFVFVHEAITNHVATWLEDKMIKFMIEPIFWLIRRDEKILRTDQILRVGSRRWG